MLSFREGTIGPPAEQHKSGCRLDSKHGAFVLVRDDIEQPVGPLLDVADPLSEVEQQRLAPQLLEALIEEHAVEPSGARDLAVAEAADEKIAFPLRQCVAQVE